MLDNFEHLLPAAPLIGELLAAAPALAVLATSREPLRLQAEHRYAVAPLEVPTEADPAAVAQAAAGALFVERARSHDRSFELTAGNAAAVAEICRHLDGLPLAIELAAARTTVLDPEQLNARLASALEVLGGGPRDAPDRQRTLRATIDWSHRLLDAPEAEAFARFAVFAGGATAEAAQEVTGANIDALQGLVDKQLLLRGHVPAQIPGCRCSKRCASTPASGSPRTRTPPKYMSAIAGTTSPLPSGPSPSCSLGGKPSGCRGSTPKSRTSGRRLTGASGMANPRQGCGSPDYWPGSGTSATGAPRGATGSRRRSKRRVTTPPSGIAPELAARR